MTLTTLLIALAPGWLAASCALESRVPGSRPAGVTVPWTADRCLAAGRDADVDGVDDDCELELASALAPELVVDRRDCSWDATARPARLGGGYLFAVQRTPDRRAVRIAYMPAYHHDCGWEGLPCVTKRRECAAHAGDSELIVVETRSDASGRWVTEGIFLSAHCFGRSSGRCRWYRGSELRYFSWAGAVARGAPRVWVARGKHANYPSARECDTGHWYYDSCDGNSAAYRFPVLSNAQNVGSRRRPLPLADASSPAGCLAAERLPLRSIAADIGTRECLWSADAAFRGWQRDPAGTSPAPYGRVLREGAGF